MATQIKLRLEADLDLSMVMARVVSKKEQKAILDECRENGCPEHMIYRAARISWKKARELAGQDKYDALANGTHEHVTILVDREVARFLWGWMSE